MTTIEEFETKARQAILDLDAKKRQGLLRFDEEVLKGKPVQGYQAAVQMGLSCRYEPVYRKLSQEKELAVTLDDVCNWCLSTLADNSPVVQRIRKTGPATGGQSGCSVEVTIG